MSVTKAEEGRHVSLILTGVFLLVVVGAAADLVMDRPSSLVSLHVVFEVVILVASLGGATYLGLGWYATGKRLAEVRFQSDQRKHERDEWERRASDLLAGLSQAISAQFDHWNLTPTERRIGLMLLQGHSHKRIARLTDTSERTVRQHSVLLCTGNPGSPGERSSQGSSSTLSISYHIGVSCHPVRPRGGAHNTRALTPDGLFSQFPRE